MILALPLEIIIGGLSVGGVLIGIVWNEQGKKINEIKKIQESRSCNTICSHIESIKVDIEWIKKEINKM
jgi:hypothetical protein